MYIYNVYILYYSGNFRGRKLSQLMEKTIFMVKTFTNNHKTAKVAKVFSLKSCLLYGISSVAMVTYITLTGGMHFHENRNQLLSHKLHTVQ